MLTAAKGLTPEQVPSLTTPAQHCDLPPCAPLSSSSSPPRQLNVSASHADSRSASPPREASPQPAPQKKPSLAELRRKVSMSIKNPTNLPPRPAPPDELPLRTSSSVSPAAPKAPKAPALPPPAPPPASLPLPGSQQPTSHAGVTGAMSPSPFDPERTFATRASQQALM